MNVSFKGAYIVNTSINNKGHIRSLDNQRKMAQAAHDLAKSLGAEEYVTYLYQPEKGGRRSQILLTNDPLNKDAEPLLQFKKFTRVDSQDWEPNNVDSGVEDEVYQTKQEISDHTWNLSQALEKFGYLKALYRGDKLY